MTEQAVFGAGCFWGVEQAFAAMPGVTATSVGYTGGKVANPTYQQVCTDRTGHAEVVQVTYDPTKILYAALVEKFLALHDPTQLNRQGPDVGTQYRSAIFATPEQQDIARQVIEQAQASGRFKKPIVTTIEPAQAYWPAEDYHQKYLEKRGGGSCHI